MDAMGSVLEILYFCEYSDFICGAVSRDGKSEKKTSEVTGVKWIEWRFLQKSFLEGKGIDILRKRHILL
ncbi:MAG: hypothetical protein LBH38_00065 [Holosporales bacterium]|nr:hypothetical protein [Holosporales bacterium]